MRKIILLFLIVFIRKSIGEDAKAEVEPEKATSNDWDRRYLNKDWREDGYYGDRDRNYYRNDEYYNGSRRGYYNEKDRNYNEKDRNYNEKDRNYKDGRYDYDDRNNRNEFDKDGNYFDQNPVMRNLSSNLNDINLDNFGDISSGSGFELRERYNLRNARRRYDFGNPDVFGRRERPCRIYDMFCIRNYFAKHGKCKIRTGPAPDPAYRAQSAVYVPRANITAVQNDITLFGLNGRITEFYVDKITDKLIISIEFKGLTIMPKYLYFNFHRPRRENLRTEGFASIRYDSVIITSIIPKLEDLQLDRLEFYVFINDPAPQFFVSPTLIPVQDPGALGQFAVFLDNFIASLKEMFITDGSFYPATYIQYNLCDFGLKIL